MTAADDDWRPRRPNRWATAGLVCGIAGLFGVTAVAAILLGLVGRRRAAAGGVGRRAATTGLWLGVAWLALLAIGGAAGYWIVRDGATFVARQEIGRTVAAINHLAAAGPAGVERLSAGRAKELAEVARPLGVCRGITVTDAAFINRDGVFGITFGGVARFDRGTWPLRVRLAFDGVGWTITELDWL